MAVQMNLLKCVQMILSATKGDEVNTWNETAESVAVVDALENTFNDLISTLDIPEFWDFFELVLPTTAKPTSLVIPSFVGKVEYIQYDCSDLGADVEDWRTITPIHKAQFFTLGQGLDASESNVYAYDYEPAHGGTFPVRGFNDRAPTCYATVDDYNVIFDNYNSSYSSSIVANKTRGYGMIIPTFERDDEYVPPFTGRQFTVFFNMAKAQVFAEQKEAINPTAEARARRALVQTQRKGPVVPAGEIRKPFTPNYGRRHR